MKFENLLNKTEHKTALRNALIDWCLGSDGMDGAIGKVLGKIPWTVEMESIKKWSDVDERINTAIGASLKVDSGIVTNSYKRESFLFYIDKKVENIVKVYGDIIDEMNKKCLNCMVVEKVSYVDSLGFCHYEIVEKVYGETYYDCICDIWEKYHLNNTSWKFKDFVDACYRSRVHINDNLYLLPFGDKATNS